jgi:hypothetical protein
MGDALLTGATGLGARGEPGSALLAKGIIAIAAISRHALPDMFLTFASGSEESTS